MKKLLAVLLLVLTASLHAQDYAGVASKLAEAGRALEAAAALLAVPSAPSNLRIAAGVDLQAALDTAQPGATITLARGVTFSGSFVLPVKSGDGFITIRTEGDAGFPEVGTRITPAASGSLAKLKSPSNEPAIRTAPGAHHWRLQLLELSTSDPRGEILRCGEGAEHQTTIEQVPHDLVFDRLYIHGDPLTGQKRGMAGNCSNLTLTDSYISDIKAVGQDSQAWMSWNTPGPITLTNNYLEAACENLMLGGADSASAAFIPSHVKIIGNLFVKPIAWRGQGWSVKNLLELKAGIDVTVTGNTFENSWVDGQAGWGLVLTVRNQDNTAPWTTIRDVLISGNVFRHIASGVQVLGLDTNAPSVRMARVRIEHNQFEDIDPIAYGGGGKQIYMAGGPEQLWFRGNTFTGNAAELNSAFYFEGEPLKGFIVQEHEAPEGTYGIFRDGGTPGIKSLIDSTLPDRIFEAVTFHRAAGGANYQYPQGTKVQTP